MLSRKRVSLAGPTKSRRSRRYVEPSILEADGEMFRSLRIAEEKEEDLLRLLEICVKSLQIKCVLPAELTNWLMCMYLTPNPNLHNNATFLRRLDQDAVSAFIGNGQYQPNCFDLAAVSVFLRTTVQSLITDALINDAAATEPSAVATFLEQHDLCALPKRIRISFTTLSPLHMPSRWSSAGVRLFLIRVYQFTQGLYAPTMANLMGQSRQGAEELNAAVVECLALPRIERIRQMNHRPHRKGTKDTSPACDTDLDLSDLQNATLICKYLRKLNVGLERIATKLGVGVGLETQRLLERQKLKSREGKHPNEEVKSHDEDNGNTAGDDGPPHQYRRNEQDQRQPDIDINLDLEVDRLVDFIPECVTQEPFAHGERVDPRQKGEARELKEQRDRNSHVLYVDRSGVQSGERRLMQFLQSVSNGQKNGLLGVD